MEVCAVPTPPEYAEADIQARIEQAVAEKEQALRLKDQEMLDARTRMEQMEKKLDDATASFEKQLAAMREHLSPGQLQVIGGVPSGKARQRSRSRLATGATGGEPEEGEGREKQARQVAAS